MKDLDKLKERRLKARQRADKVDTEYTLEKAKQDDLARLEIGHKTLDIIEALPAEVRDGYVETIAPTLSKIAIAKLVSLGHLEQQKADNILREREETRKMKKTSRTKAVLPKVASEDDTSGN
ncbi:glycoside hydrolase [Pseudooceanicola sp. 200-1SW]|uniref:glycoside hydrolase n=1 Tax=Pseudooceanicola sp. 200-1SW TaxID=3425949 RepID=UPI003D7FF8F3